MGTQGPGRKRTPNREKLTAEDDALNQIAREAEARLAAKRAARAEAREIRMKELERQQKEVSDDEEKMSVGSRGSFRVEDRMDRMDRDLQDKGSRTASTLSAATLASLGGASSRRGSCDTSFSVETEASIREIKDSLVEAEEKYRKAMVSNAQLHNDKSTLMYQVEALREELSDMEELLWETRRHGDDAHKELERERQEHGVLQFHFKHMKETLSQTEQLLTEHGVVVSADITTNGDAGEGGAEDDVSTDSAFRLAEESGKGGRQSVLELRLKKLFEERESLHDQVRLLKSQLDQRQKKKKTTDGVRTSDQDQLQTNGTDQDQNQDQDLELDQDLDHLLDQQRDANRQISELKFKLVKSEQEAAALEQNVIRLEGQVTRYKSASENAEKVEDELKVEKRRLQRELRSALDRIDELEVANAHLSKRLEKMKANRSALLAQQ